MLILTRRPGQTFMIGNDIVVTVLNVRDVTVQIGISAPRSIPVHRLEVYERIRAAEAANAKDGGEQPASAAHDGRGPSSMRCGGYSESRRAIVGDSAPLLLDDYDAARRHDGSADEKAR